jgi:hypothetical protein
MNPGEGDLVISRHAFVLFSLLAAGCDSEDPEDPILVGAECASLIDRGDTGKAVELAKEHKFHGVALMLLDRLAAEADYFRGCELVSDLCEVTGIDIPYGCGVPVEDQPLWARQRLTYWRAWLYSREGLAFLESGTSNGRSIWGDDDLAAFLNEMSGGARKERPPHGADRLDDDH